MIYTSWIYLNEKQEELIFPDNDSDLLYRVQENHFDDYINHHVPWHWHPFLEFAYILEGDIEYHFPDGMKLFHKGDALFINTNVLHMIRPHNDQKGCRLRVILVNPEFLSGPYQGQPARKYFLPVFQCPRIQIYPVKPDHMEGIKMIDELLSAMNCDRKQEFGYEFQVRLHLTDLWLLLLKETAELHSECTAKNDISIERLKAMLTYIEKNYGEKIELKHIAASANISERECFRCFKKNLFMTPIEYLNNYRVNIAANLLTQTTKTVITVSEECGFSSNSYFTKVFRKTMNCTPKEFQKRNEKRIET